MTRLPENHIALFIFGDSYFESGNNNYINTTTFFQANFPPYGETFFKYANGRFSDGRVISDFIAEYAKLPPIPPFLHPEHRDDEYIYGVNFASAGAGALAETNPGFVIGLKTQSLYFAQVIKQWRLKLGEEKANKLLSTAVYIFSIGGNDYAAPFYTKFSNGLFPYSKQKFVDFVIGNITTAIKEIYIEGGRKFGFLNVLPPDCTPFLRRFVNGTTIEECLEKEASKLARLHNNALLKVLQDFEKQLEGFKYSILNLYDALLQLMKYPSKYGFEEGNVACCGGGSYRGDFSYGGKRGIEEYELCNNVRKHVYFDSSHLTESAAEHFAQLMWNGSNDVIDSYNLEQLFLKTF
ncbi:hypothetical protein Fmac_010807 [Flemingia macrophylla]|uniref:Uncharacterized protein n=1 Tax=Flemingia macrophylla TaxID=520843 RepID=A0ABD1MKY0_9FABA